MEQIFSRARAAASTVRLFISKATRKDAFEARDLARVTTLHFDEAYRVVLRAKTKGIESVHVYYVMTALNLDLNDAIKMIDDPDTPY